MIEIEDFMGKYPFIESNNVSENENFNYDIFRLKEFYDEKLEKTEIIPEQKGQFMKHQRIIYKFLSSYTPYNSLLLYHEMGTGKTAASIGVVENIRNTSEMYKGAVVLAKGKGLLRNYKHELLQSTGSRYIPDNFNSLTTLQKTHRLNKMIGEFYQLSTYETFSKQIKKMSRSQIVKNYSNRIIIIDEVHNIRVKNAKKDEIDIYNDIHSFLHTVKNCKILLMSGTPMKDSPEEISSIMNLILDENEQLPSELNNDFTNEFFVDEGNDLFSLRQDKLPLLKEKFKGRVSYLGPIFSTVRKNFVGERLGDLEHFKVYADMMDEFQGNIYREAVGKDLESKGIYNNSRQAILSVYPDGTYGDEGYKKYIIEKKKGNKNIPSFSLSKDFKNVLKNNDGKYDIEKLRKYSVKYYNVIKQIIADKDEGKKSFIYCEFVQGSGLILLTLLLELFGFSKTSGNVKSEGLRYAAISNKTMLTSDIERVIERFNQEDNKNGDYINVIIGSKVISEGFTLKNIQSEHILTPHWNYSETSQAIARGWRTGSHDHLLKDNENIILNIYLHVSRYPTLVSIDLRMYEMSENKDINIKKIERLIKETAFDCALTYKRNFVEGFDGQRECQYTTCDYECDGITKDKFILEDNEIDTTNYNLYYYNEISSILLEEIKNIFKEEYKISSKVLFEKLNKFNKHIILKVLNNLINENIILYDDLELPYYLRTDNNTYYLTNIITFNTKLNDLSLVSNPYIRSNYTFEQLLEKKLYNTYYPGIIKQIFNANQSVESLEKLPNTILFDVLEKSVYSKYNIDEINSIRDSIINYLINQKRILTFNSEINIYYYFNNQNFRCFDISKNAWEDCDKKFIENLEKQIDTQSQDIKNNDFGYYILMEDGKIKIVDIQDTKSKGKVCITWNKKDIIEIIDKTNLSISEVINKILNDTIKLNKTKKDQIQFNIEDKINDFQNLSELVNFYKLAKEDLCQILLYYFNKNNLIIYK